MSNANCDDHHAKLAKGPLDMQPGGCIDDPKEGSPGSCIATQHTKPQSEADRIRGCQQAPPRTLAALCPDCIDDRHDPGRPVRKALV